MVTQEGEPPLQARGLHSLQWSLLSKRQGSSTADKQSVVQQMVGLVRHKDTPGSTRGQAAKTQLFCHLVFQSNLSSSHVKSQIRQIIHQHRGRKGLLVPLIKCAIIRALLVQQFGCQFQIPNSTSQGLSFLPLFQVSMSTLTWSTNFLKCRLTRI